MLTAGDRAVDFTLNDENGEPVSLSSLRGKVIVLYFYPKDNTSGCSTEAVSFKDVHQELTAAGAVVLGVSPDGQASHKRFRDKYDLPFHLLSDTGHAVASAYGAWGEKKVCGKSCMGIIRSTFIIGKDFEILKVYPKVSPRGHGQEVLDALAAMPLDRSRTARQ